MAIVETSDLFGNVAPTAQQMSVARLADNRVLAPDPTTAEEIRAAWASSEASAFADAVTWPDFTSLDVDGYNPFELDVAPDDPDAGYYLFSRSPYETQWIRRKLIGERQAQQTLRDGGWSAFGWSLMTESIAPSNLLVPFGMGAPSKALLKATTRAAMARTAARGATVFGSAVAVGEGFMQAGQLTRTAEDSAVAIATGIGLGTLLGGATGAFRVARLQSLEVLSEVEARQGLLAEKVAKYLDSADFENAAASRRIEIAEAAFRQAGEEIGVEFGQVVTPKSMLARFATKGLRFTVNGVGATSRSTRMQVFTHQMMDTVFGRARIRATGPSMESLISRGELHLTGAHAATRTRFLAYKKQRRVGPGEVQKEDDFFTEVGRALRREGRAPEWMSDGAKAAVEDSAKMYREWIDEFITKPLVDSGFLNKHDLNLKGTAPSYLTRYFKRQEIKLQRRRFIEDITNALVREQELDPGEAAKQAKSLYETIVGDPASAISLNLPGAPTPSMDRTLMLTDEALGEWIENDVRLVTNKLVTHTYPQLQLAKMQPSAGGFMEDLRRTADRKLERAAAGDVNAANDLAEETLDARARAALISRMDDEGLEKSERLGALAERKHSRVEAARNEGRNLRALAGDDVGIARPEVPDEDLVLSKRAVRATGEQERTPEALVEYAQAERGVKQAEARVRAEEDELLDAMVLEEEEMARTEFEWWRGGINEAAKNPRPLRVSEPGFQNWAKENAPQVVGERRRYQAVARKRRHREKMANLVNRRRLATARAQDDIADLERRLSDRRDVLREEGASSTRALKEAEKQDAGVIYLKERLETARKNLRRVKGRQRDAEARYRKAEDNMPEPLHVARERVRAAEEPARAEYLAEQKRKSQREPVLRKKDLKARRKDDPAFQAALDLRRQAAKRVKEAKSEMKRVTQKRDQALEAIRRNEEATREALSEDALASYDRLRRLQAEIAELDEQIVALRKDAKDLDSGLRLRPDRYEKGMDAEAAVARLQNDLTVTTRRNALRGASGESHLRGIADEWEAIVENAPESQKPKLRAEAERDIETARLMIRRLTNMADIEENPDALYKKLMKGFRNLNFVRFMGGVVLSSLPDLFMGVLVNGWGPYLRAMRNALRDPIRNLVRREHPDTIARLIATLEASTSMRTRRAFIDPTGSVSGTVKPTATERLSQVFSSLTGINWWNGTMRQTAALMAQDRVLRLALRVADDLPLTKLDRLDMRLAGLSTQNMRRIAKQYRRRLPDGTQVGQADPSGLHLSRSELWDDEGIREIYEAAILMDVNRTNIIPSKGDMPAPIFNSPELTKTILQFKSFALSATNKITASGTERLRAGDMRVVHGVLGMVMTGGFAEMLKRELAGRDQPEDEGDWIFSAIDRSGVLGLLMELNNIIDQGTFAQGPLNALLGAPTSTRYDARNILDTFLGPSLGTAKDAIDGMNTISKWLGSGEASAAELGRLRRLAWFQNLFYTRWLFDQIQDTAAAKLQLTQ